MGETYIKVAGQWKYLYRVVDRAGDTVDFLLTAKRDMAAARRFLERAINLHDLPEKITIDKSGANTAAIESVKAVACVDILMRQNKYWHSPKSVDKYDVKTEMEKCKCDEQNMPWSSSKRQSRPIR